MKLKSYGFPALSACAILLASTANAAPRLDKAIFEYNAGLRIQEEFNLFADGNISDPDYPNSALRIQLNTAKSYEQVGFYDKVNSIYGQAVAYNTLDRRWLKLKGKLLYFSGESDGSRKVDVIQFRVINPANEASPWAEVRVSLDNAFDINYDVYPSDDSAQTQRDQPVEIFVKANDADVPYYFGVEIFSRPQHGSVSVNNDYSVTYTPDAGYIGPDSFQYRIKGNNLYDITSAAATVSVQVAQ